MSSISSEETSYNKEELKDSKAELKNLLNNSKSKLANQCENIKINCEDLKKENLDNNDENLEKPIIESTKKNENKKKCTSCGKSLKLIDISIGKCRCGHLYCKKHRFPEIHECSFDYRENNQKELQKIHKKVVASKLIKI